MCQKLNTIKVFLMKIFQMIQPQSVKHLLEKRLFLQKTAPEGISLYYFLYSDMSNMGRL